MNTDYGSYFVGRCSRKDSCLERMPKQDRRTACSQAFGGTEDVVEPLRCGISRPREREKEVLACMEKYTYSEGGWGTRRDVIYPGF